MLVHLKHTHPNTYANNYKPWGERLNHDAEKNKLLKGPIQKINTTWYAGQR